MAKDEIVRRLANQFVELQQITSINNDVTLMSAWFQIAYDAGREEAQAEMAEAASINTPPRPGEFPNSRVFHRVTADGFYDALGEDLRGLISRAGDEFTQLLAKKHG